MKIQGVILAAGKGVRMLPFTTHFPKPLLPVCNKPIIQYQIETMKSLGVQDIIIVIGHLGFEIVRVIGDGREFGVKIRYVEQEQSLGIAHATYKLEQEIDSPFLLFLGDIFFQTTNLRQMLEEFKGGNASAVLATKIEKEPDAIQRNFAVICSPNGDVKRVIEKPKHVLNNIKGCGIYLFSLDVFDALRRTPKTAMRDEYEITDAIQILIDDGNRVIHRNVIKNDTNLTFPLDLLKCNLNELRRLRKESLIGSNCIINKEMKISNSIIGNNVSLTQVGQIRNSVIFSEANIDKPVKKFTNAIVTPYQIINC